MPRIVRQKCVECFTWFEYTQTRGPQRKYCSDVCKTIAKNRRDRIAAQEKKGFHPYYDMGRPSDLFTKTPRRRLIDAALDRVLDAGIDWRKRKQIEQIVKDVVAETEDQQIRAYWNRTTSLGRKMTVTRVQVETGKYAGDVEPDDI